MDIAKPLIRIPGINRSHPLARGLVAAWPMWELTGRQVMDVAGGTSNAHGVFSSVSGTGPVWTGGNLSFTGADDDYLETGGIDLTDTFTIVFYCSSPGSNFLFCGGNNNEITIERRTAASTIRLVRSNIAVVSTSNAMGNQSSTDLVVIGCSNVSTDGTNGITRFFLGRPDSSRYAEVAHANQGSLIPTLRTIGKQSNDAGSYNGVMRGVLAWKGRALTESDFDLLNTDFFGVFRPEMAKRAARLFVEPVSGITDGEIAAAATSFDNRPHKPGTILVPY